MTVTTNVATVIGRVIRREGGWSNDPLDHGGATKYGITAPFLSDVLGRPATPDDVARLTESDARVIYARWMERAKLDRITNLGVLDAVTDFAVLSGQKAAVMALQRALDVVPDGVLGPVTFAALQASDPHEIRDRVLGAQLRKIGTIVAANPTQVRFLRGWINRLANVLES